jgi:pimeloyl-ACP methyl ester carboxylesterase
MTAVAPYGSWESPIDAAAIARSWIAPAEVQADGDTLWWLEQRPAESGRQVACRWEPGGKITTVTPDGFSARSTVHEYGGGAYLARGGTAWFSGFADQRLYRQAPGGAPVPVSPAPATPGGLRYADPCLTPDGAWLICVRERHAADGSGTVTNDLVAAPAGRGDQAEPRVLAGGRDFYDDFGAGASYFGIADAEALARDMHNFESGYIPRLFGGDPGALRERSPIRFTERLSCPVILLQGLDDAIVPPAQARAMAAALDASGIPYSYLGFEGEQHGFRRAENLQRAVEAELFFYGAIFGFAVADDIEPVQIHHLSSPVSRTGGRQA